jgi:hypothetical protein
MNIIRKIASLLSRKLSLGEAVPAGFGVAWQAPRERHIVAMPIGLNVVARGLRRLWLWARYAGAASVSESPAYHAGFLAGRRDAAARITKPVARLLDASRNYSDAAQNVIYLQGQVLHELGKPRMVDLDTTADYCHQAAILDSSTARMRAQLKALHNALI